VTADGALEVTSTESGRCRRRRYLAIFFARLLEAEEDEEEEGEEEEEDEENFLLVAFFSKEKETLLLLEEVKEEEEEEEEEEEAVMAVEEIPWFRRERSSPCPTGERKSSPDSRTPVVANETDGREEGSVDLGEVFIRGD